MTIHLTCVIISSMKYLGWSIFLVIFFIGFIGCRLIDQTLVRQELKALQDSIHEGLLPSDTFPLFVTLNTMLSSDTLYVLGQRHSHSQSQNIPNIPSIISHYFDDIQSRIVINKGSTIELKAHHILSSIPFIDTKAIPGIATMIEDQYQDIQDGQEIYGYWFDHKFLCKYECACYAIKFTSLINAHASANVVIIPIKITGGGAGVKVKRGFGMQSTYLYHVTSIIVDLKDYSAGVIDPIIFGDAKIYPLSSLYERIINVSTMTFSTFYHSMRR